MTFNYQDLLDARQRSLAVGNIPPGQPGSCWVPVGNLTPEQVGEAPTITVKIPSEKTDVPKSRKTA